MTASSTGPYTIAELMICAMAREIRDGEFLAQGIATHLPTSAYFLAKRTHAPHCWFLYSVGGSLSTGHGQVSLLGMEALALEAPLKRIGYAEIVCDLLPGLSFMEFSRPAQLDRYGNTNNVVIGPHARPKLRLPGVGGISDFSPYESHRAFLYLPSHEPKIFVERLDFLSGVGGLQGQSHAERAQLGVTGRGTQRLVTNLGVFEFDAQGMHTLSLHAGVDAAQVRAATGFELDIPPTPAITQAPSAQELRLIREEIDPLEARELEFLSGAARLARIRTILAIEEKTLGRQTP